MRINAINIVQSTYSSDNFAKRNSLKRASTVNPNITFKGEKGQAIGAALGMLAGVVASVAVGPLAALLISGAGLVGGSITGDKIEDKLDDDKKK